MSMNVDVPSDDAAFHKGDRIRKVRERAGFKEIKDFADRTGLDRGTLGRYEATGEVPRKSALITISLATGARLEWLESGRGAMYNTPDGPNGGVPGGFSESLRSGVLRSQDNVTPIIRELAAVA